MTYDTYPSLSRRSLLVAGAVGVLSLSGLLEACSSPEPNPFASTPAWEQDFSTMQDGLLNPHYWAINTGVIIPGYNKEAEALTDRPQNVRIESGMLILEGRKESQPYDNRNYTSARVVTRQMFPFGKLEVNAQLPSGQGSWPAIWLLPTTRGLYSPQAFGINPASNKAWAINGEIDICEARGSHPGIIASNLHSYATVALGRELTDYATQLAVPNCSAAFNTYGIERTPGKIVFTLNGQPHHTATKKPSDDPTVWPFDQPMNLILNVALGGNYGGPIAGNGPWPMGIKTIRYYPLATAQ